MSSRKMSDSGWRPAVVTSFSIRNWEPAFGPRFTTRRACPSRRSSSGRWISSPVSSSISVGVRPTVVSSCSGCPHLAQNLDSAGLRCPHRVQYTLTSPRGREDPKAEPPMYTEGRDRSIGSRALVGVLDQTAVRLGVQQAPELSGLGGLDQDH